MATQRTFSQIVQSMMERLRLTQPNLDTKTGTVSRDLFVDIQADEFDRLYKSVKIVSNKQSPELARGRDLDRWARNYGLLRKSGALANGIVIYTTNELNSDIPVPSSTMNSAKNGYQFKTIGNYVMSVAQKNKYAANANRLRSALNLAGITDSFAMEVPVAATRVGSSGNIAPLQIVNSDLADGLKVVNLVSFSGGANSETDAAFRARIFAVFSGANTGTASGYRNAALGTSGVLDSLVVKPGNTLMLRDGTETIEVNDGSFRILNSGTGGKVDVYILGKNLEEITESYIYSDLSGIGDPTDERNDYIPGLFGLDSSLTSEERRVKAFEEGKIPLQPVDTIVSVVGSSSGIFAEAVFATNGTFTGNYELIKDENVETGGSPFGFDKVKFVSNVKTVDGESITKTAINSVDALRFTDVNAIDAIYQDIQISGENSSRASSDRSVVILNHTPIVSVSRVSNVTTGEVYVIDNQNFNNTTGLNTSGKISISGKTLPSRADVLSTDYIWRHEFDNYIDFNGADIVGIFTDDDVSDSVDWGVANGIMNELSIITQTDDGFEFTIKTDFSISRVLSVFFAEEVVGTVALITDSDGEEVKGLELASSDSEISNIISVTDSDKVEVYDTIDANGTFSSRTIYLPDDTSAEVGEELTVFFNKVELFDIDDGNGSFSDTTITLPSQDILEGGGLLDSVDQAFLSEEDVYITYVAEINEIVPTLSLTSLPINGSGTSNELFDSSLTSLVGSNQPVFFAYDSNSAAVDISRFGPTRVGVEVSGTIKPGRIKVVGTTLTRHELTLTAGLSISGLIFDIKSELKEAMGLSSLPSSLFISRVDRVVGLDSDVEYDMAGQLLMNNTYSFGVAGLDESLDSTKFALPSTKNNDEISLTSGEKVKVSVLIGDSNDFETLYFGSDTEVITDKRFARIDTASVSSGFRSSSGTLVGTVTLTPTGQPDNGLTYNVVYNFKAPTEGERISVKYNLNRLVATVTNNIEVVRPITADVLVKEAFEIGIDVVGEIVIASDAESGSQTVLENVINAVVNLLNTSSLGSAIDYSDIITVAAGVTGVESVNISQFNESGKQGRKTSIRSLDNQSIVAGSVSFSISSRQDFRIT